MYVSPLKALGNDIQRNLQEPLAEILRLARTEALILPEIRVAVRSGDTSARERQLMTRRPPHILITTPESLYILLTAERSRRIIKDLDCVIWTKSMPWRETSGAPISLLAWNDWKPSPRNRSRESA